MQAALQWQRFGSNGLWRAAYLKGESLGASFKLFVADGFFGILFDLFDPASTVYISLHRLSLSKD